MLQRLRDAIGVFLQLRKRGRRFRRWRRDHPGASYAVFYAEDARRRIELLATKRIRAPRTLGRHVDPAGARRRAESLLGYLKWAGCRPEHMVVDFGCGSLWVGEVLMSYLRPGGYVGLDVIDHFYREACERLGADFIAERCPTLEVISPTALRRARARNPDFILSTAVLLHVRPAEMAAYFAQIIAMAGPATRIVIGHKPHGWTRAEGLRNLQYGRPAIRAALAGLGYEARFDRAADAPQCQIALFEIVPMASARNP